EQSFAWLENQAAGLSQSSGVIKSKATKCKVMKDMFGTIRHKTARGFAFIRRESVNDRPVQDIFLHISEFVGDWERLKAGDHVEFTPGIRRNNPIAVDVRLLEEPTDPEVGGGSDEQA